MAMQCNIDARGRFLRLVSGIVITCAGAAVLILTMLGTLTGWWPWLTGVILTAAGVFQIYEGWCGWCVLRALGFKTPV